jgi:hypothetical protein
VPVKEQKIEEPGKRQEDGENSDQKITSLVFSSEQKP